MYIETTNNTYLYMCVVDIHTIFLWYSMLYGARAIIKQKS